MIVQLVFMMARASQESFSTAGTFVQLASGDTGKIRGALLLCGRRVRYTRVACVVVQQKPISAYDSNIYAVIANASRSSFHPKLVDPITSALRPLSVCCCQVGAMTGVCHFHMRVAQEAGMVSEKCTKTGRATSRAVRWKQYMRLVPG